ncbi:hypothetical protein L9F63_024894, partial [Diploptera punctata]
FLSKAFWLIFLTSEISVRNFFMNINIPLDSEFLVVQSDNGQLLSEVFRLKPTSPLQIYRLGAYKSKDILTLSQSGFVRRRINFHKLIIKTG